MRLIDADALDTVPWEEPGDAVKAIRNAPTIDAVPVVRCKDCVRFVRNRGITDSPNGHCFYLDVEMNGHDFCSYGERKGGEG